jgi:hypothetical protein
MTLLRRAPREVYRVYDEEEFLAYADGGECSQVTMSGVGGRRLHRVASATMLVAAIGAVGGLVAIVGLSSVAGDRRRVGAGLLTATGSFASSRAARIHIWRERAGSRPRHQSARDRWAERVRGVRRAGVSRAGARLSVLAAASRRQISPAEVVAPASVARLTATVSAESQRSGQSEFGFER